MVLVPHLVATPHSPLVTSCGWGPSGDRPPAALCAPQLQARAQFGPGSVEYRYRRPEALILPFGRITKINADIRISENVLVDPTRAAPARRAARGTKSIPIAGVLFFLKN
eukprot:SAG31_NODE_18_length_35375_cov_22.525315_18_plen_110_part_00